MDFDINNHSVFLLRYHLIMCIKYRNKVIDNKISERLKEIFGYICPKYNITLEEWNHDMDHVHVLFRGQPNTEISKFIKGLVKPFEKSFGLVMLIFNNQST